jgi:predicted transposase YbfD/YdcC
MSGSVIEVFGGLTDPRVERTRLHELIDIVTVAVCGAICGADSWVEIEEFGRAKEAWLRQFLHLPNGIASPDTFGEVFSRLDPDEFQRCFREWVQAVYEVTGGQVIAVDGKAWRGSHERGIGKAAIYMVNAWASQNHRGLGQAKVAEHSNEITAIPALLNLLAISGCIVTIDALGCQTEIAQTIIDRGADYVLSVKENQGTLYEDVEDLFKGALEVQFRDTPHTYARTVNKGHGRIELRRCWAISEPEYLAYLRRKDEWAELHTVVMVQRERRLADQVTVETAYYISSLPNDAARLLAAVRSHWSVENSLHWVLDIAFREDSSRVRKGFGDQNFAVLRQMALNLLKQEKTASIGVKAKRLKAAWDERYLLRVLTASI